MPTEPPDSVTAESPSAPVPSTHLARRSGVPAPVAADVGAPAAASAATPAEARAAVGALACEAEVSTVPSANSMPPRARTVPATSSVACGSEVPMPTRPSGVTRICSLSSPEKRSPVRKVRAPEVEVTCPSRPSCATTVAGSTASSRRTVGAELSPAASKTCFCAALSRAASAGRRLTDFSATLTPPGFRLSLPERDLTVNT